MSGKRVCLKIGVLTALKYMFLVSVFLCLFSALYFVYLYFNPFYESFDLIFPDNRFGQELMEKTVTAEKGTRIYSAFWCVVWAIISFCFYRFVKSRITAVKEYERKQSPEMMSLLVDFGKRRSELISEIDSCGHDNARLIELGTKVKQYNADANAFAEQHGVSPQLISYSDYDAKLD